MLQPWVLIGPSAVSRAGPLHEDAWTHQHHAIANEWLGQGVVKEIGGWERWRKGVAGSGGVRFAAPYQKMSYETRERLQSPGRG